MCKALYKDYTRVSLFLKHTYGVGIIYFFSWENTWFDRLSVLPTRAGTQL